MFGHHFQVGDQKLKINTNGVKVLTFLCVYHKNDYCCVFRVKTRLIQEKRNAFTFFLNANATTYRRQIKTAVKTPIKVEIASMYIWREAHDWEKISRESEPDSFSDLLSSLEDLSELRTISLSSLSLYCGGVGEFRWLESFEYLRRRFRPFAPLPPSPPLQPLWNLARLQIWIPTREFVSSLLFPRARLLITHL